MMVEETKYAVICDEAACYESGGDAESESYAKAFARDAGFVQRDGKDYCAKHAAAPVPTPRPKKKRVT